ncbi:hypothetical protein LTR37_003900 [Vermiconidia calcicola]|uniref:Uncharacterized protein n=1 Tax=Vermiconidia calcicola TaxID=1690605 RepID=A0ACC3NNP0_9PEZI|nr:hypothetical protein LTR37_003900 [Vermiconidia calcicola]
MSLKSDVRVLTLRNTLPLLDELDETAPALLDELDETAPALLDELDGRAGAFVLGTAALAA